MIRPERLFSLALTGLVFLSGLLILLIPLKTPFTFYDEGFAVFNATRILHGDIPYKDFWTLYPPGQFYTLAALFKTLGTSLIVSRLYDTLARLIIVFSMWWIARKIASQPLAHLALITSALLLAFASFYSYAVFPSLAFCLLSILCLTAYVDSARKFWLILVGLFIGLAAFFRWDIGVYAAVSVAATLFVYHYLFIGSKSSFIDRTRPALFDIVFLVGAASAVVLLLYGAVGSRSGFHNLWEQAVVFPATTFPEVRRIPYPALLSPFYALANLNNSTSGNPQAELLDWLMFYFPLVVYSISIAYTFQDIRQKRVRVSGRFLGRVVVLFLGLSFFVQALSRFDIIHVIPTALMTILVVVWLLSPDIFTSAKRSTRIVFLLLFAICVVLYMFLPARSLWVSFSSFSPMECYAQTERASCVALRKDQELAVDYISRHTTEDEAIFVGNQRHDQIIMNDIGFYFLSNRESVTRYHELHPGVATTLPVQQEIAQALESNEVRWVVLVNFPESDEPNASATSSHVTFLDGFIRSKYFPVIEFGEYQIFKRSE
jgi:hypothetical protein